MAGRDLAIRLVMAEPDWKIGDTLHVRGRTWVLQESERWADCTVVRVAPLDGRAAARSLLLPFERPHKMERTPGVRVVRARGWVHEMRRRAARATPYGGAAAVCGAAARLLPYQLEPLLAMLRHGATRVLIADAVGLGKTIQAGLVLLELSAVDERFTALVLVPAGLRDQWAEELQAHLGLSPVQADAAWLRSAVSARPAGINPWALPGIYIVSIDFAKRPEVLQALEQVSWDLAVIDEAHAAAVPSDRRDAAHALARRARRTILLTATPDAGDPIRFGALCGIGRIGEAEPPVVLFRRTRADVGDGLPRRSVLLRVRPTPAEARMHRLLEQYAASVCHEAAQRSDRRARLAAIVLRKRALSSAASLALSVRRRIDLLTSVALPIPEQRLLPLDDEDSLEDAVDDGVLSAPGLADAGREHRWLAEVAEAAREAARAESKMHRLRRWLARIREPVIVFTEYRDTLMNLETLLKDAGRDVVLLHGGLDRHERSRVQRLFNRGGLSLLATDAAAEGLNLHHHCRLVVHYELPWRPSRLEQRAGRIDRLGQTRRVHELALVAADTAESLVIGRLVDRASRGVTAAGLDAIGESVVTDLVMQASSWLLAPAIPTSSTTPSIVTKTIDLRREAAREAARLTACRAAGLTPRRRRRDPVHRPLTLIAAIAPCRVSLQPGVVLVFDMSLTDTGGRRVHSETIAIALEDAASAGLDRSGTSLRRLLEGLRAKLEEPDSPLPAIVSQRILTMRERVEPLYRGCQRELQRRETLMSAGSSAAQQMVQVGLFDRRAVKVLAARAAARDAQLYESDTRLGALEGDGTLVGSQELVGLLLVRRRKAVPR